MLRSLVFVLCSFCFTAAFSQSFNIGVRAGLNYSQFRGPLELNEEYSFNSGFHFGISYQQNLVDNFGIRAELQYTQIGGTKSYSGPGYYVLRFGENTQFEPGTFTAIDRDNDGTAESPGYLLEVSNAYLNIPITAHYRINSKFELLGGAYLGFLINPTANGVLRFDSTESPLDIFFQQTLSYNYYMDEPLEFTGQGGITTVFVDDEPISVARVAKAYYQQVEKNRSTYKVLDLGLIGGLNYYFNKGFYAGARVNYGLLDVTRTGLDFSLIEYNSDESFITREDKDTNMTLEFSLGFKF